jgi:hypothetical protein
MSVTVLTAATSYRLTTLEAVMAEITLADQVLFAESLIDQASAAVARECMKLGGIVAQQAYREVQGITYRGPYLFLRYRPLVSASSVGYGSTVITDYRIESAESGMLYRHDGWGCWPGCGDEWTVDYIAGYVLPEQLTPPAPTGPTLREQAADLERATIETIKVWFHERMVETRIEARTLGDQRIDYGVQARHTGIPALAKDLLRHWRGMLIA